MPVPVATFLAAIALGLLPAAAEGAWRAQPTAADGAWRAPVRGAVLGSFTFSPATPYAAGARRGLDLAARPGEPVRAPCDGRVTFAGRLPGGARVVTARCGGLVATVLGLSRTAVRRGQVVAVGDRLGRAAGTVRLGARRAGRRQGYVDPALLLAAPPRRPPAVAPLARRAPRVAPPRAGPARPRPSGGGRHRSVRREAAPDGRGVPLVAWAGLGIAAAGVGGGAVCARRGRRRQRAAAIAAPGAARAGR